MKRRILTISIVVFIALLVVGCDSFYGPRSMVLAWDVQGQGTIQLDGPVEGEKLEIEKGTIVDLKAVPADGWEFKKWIGDVKDAYSEETSILMGENKEITAVFEPIPLDPAEFKVSATTNSPVTVGDDLEVNVNVKNIGEEWGEQEIYLLLDGSKEDSRVVSLEKGESISFSFYLDTSEKSLGEYDLEVSSEDDSEKITVEFLRRLDPANFKISITDTNSPNIGDDLEVNVNVKNIGEEWGEQEIEFFFSSEKKDSKTVSLDAGSMEQISFQIETFGKSPGEYWIKVSSEDDSEKVTVEIGEKIDISFTYEDLGAGKYLFIGSIPENAKYWEWKFPSESFWWGYADENEIEYQFPEEYFGETELIKLRILDDSEEQIGTFKKEILIEYTKNTVTLKVSIEGEGGVELKK